MSNENNPFSDDINPFSGEISDEEAEVKRRLSTGSSGYAGNSPGNTPGSFDTVDDSSRGTSALHHSGAEAADNHQDIDNCGVCGAQLGKRRLNPRHHCRICGRCVCGSCSPSSVQIQGKEGLQRVCTPCVNIPEFRHRLVQLGDLLRGVSQAETPLKQAVTPPKSLSQAVALAEEAVPLVCSALRREREKAAELEVALHQSQAREQAAHAACLQMCERLASLAGINTPVSQQSCEQSDETLGLPRVTDLCLKQLDVVEQRVVLPGRLEEALGLCEAALAPLREAHETLRQQVC